MATTSQEEAAQALELMPVPVLESELDPELAQKMESIKCKAGSTVPVNVTHPGHHISGSPGEKEVIPHAVHCQQAIGITNAHKVLAFTRSLCGAASAAAEEEIEESQQAIANTDNGTVNEENPGCTFDQCIIRHCHRFGDSNSRQCQLDAIQHLKKPPSLDVDLWKTVVFSKNKCVPCLQGTAEAACSDDAMTKHCYKSCPKTWKDDCADNANNDPNADSLKKIHDFMKKQQAKARAKVAANRAAQNPQKSHNTLPARTAGSVPWSDIAVDLIGPWSFRDQDGFEHTFIALTIIDLVTDCVETIRLENKSAQHVAHQFKTQWLARHPRPNSVIFDPGPEFKGEFREMLEQFGITPSPTTVKNPQANSTCERLHLTVADVIRPMIHENPPKHSLEAAEIVDTASAAAAHASRTALHAAMKMSPGQLAFNRDMPLDIPMHADFQSLRAKRQQLIDRNLERANRKRASHDHNIGDKCLKLAYKPNELEPRAQGPCTVERIHSNGSAAIRISEFTTERINFRRLRPFWTKEVAAPSMACMT